MKNIKINPSPVKLNRQLGMTFIEVLIALVILVTGILGAVAMQATAKQGSFDAMQRSLASSLAQDIIARMRAHAPSIAPNIALNAYVSADYGALLDNQPANRCNAIAACIPADMVANDRYEWELALMGGDITTAGGQNAGGLVSGRGCISQIGNAYTVVVSWQGRTETADAGIGPAACGVNSLKRRQVVVQAFIF